MDRLLMLLPLIPIISGIAAGICLDRRYHKKMAARLRKRYERLPEPLPKVLKHRAGYRVHHRLVVIPTLCGLFLGIFTALLVMRSRRAQQPPGQDAGAEIATQVIPEQIRNMTDTASINQVTESIIANTIPVEPGTAPETFSRTSEEISSGEIDITDRENGESSMEADYSLEFYITEITDELFARMQGRSFKEDCTLPREDLRYLHLLHKNLAGETLEGEMVVNAYIAEDVLEIFKELYKAGYPIERVQLVDDYDASDEMSMRANNSSSFNFRFISYTTKVSKHGLGLAVDINTLYNPYVKQVNGSLSIEPATAEPYTHREEDFPYKIIKGDLCYELFTAHGFEWGGEWNSAKDYQHFELPDDVVEKLYPGMR